MGVRGPIVKSLSPIPMSNSAVDPNLSTYNSQAVADYYAGLNYLTPCERLLFDEYLRPGVAILDLGVGGGRTTPYLASNASRYVGIDYAPEMVAACRTKFPDLEFHVCSAADLSAFASSSFNVVLMAFNGIDYVIPDETRLQALREIHRVLTPDGLLIFSSHNPRAILVRPSWNRERVQEVARSIVKTDSVLFRPVLRFLIAGRVMLAGAQAILKSLKRSARRIPTRAFWRGHGYLFDPAHGGLTTHVAVPREVIQETNRFGFTLLRISGDDYPCTSHAWVTDWYYYVFSRSATCGVK
jgi:ubiquinone/menaquinone biosynthesis C-methylase UbiE